MITLESIIEFFDNCMENNLSIRSYGSGDLCISEKLTRKDEQVPDHWYYRTLDIYYSINDENELEISIDHSDEYCTFIKTKDAKDKALWTLCLDRIHKYIKSRAEQKFNSFIWK